MGSAQKYGLPGFRTVRRTLRSATVSATCWGVSHLGLHPDFESLLEQEASGTTCANVHLRWGVERGGV